MLTASHAGPERPQRRSRWTPSWNELGKRKVKAALLLLIPPLPSGTMSPHGSFHDIH